VEKAMSKHLGIAVRSLVLLAITAFWAFIPSGPASADTPLVPYQRLTTTEAITRLKLDQYVTPGYALSDPPDNPALRLYPELLRPGVLLYDIDGNGVDDYFFTERARVDPHGACRSVAILNDRAGFRRVEYSQYGALGLLDIDLAYLGSSSQSFLLLHTAGGQTGDLEVFAYKGGTFQRLLAIENIKPFEARLAQLEDRTFGIHAVVYKQNMEVESIYRWNGATFDQEVIETRPIQ
jgi:hypothetical protein